jgi:hypothetical protein
MTMFRRSFNKGRTRLEPSQYVPLVVRIIRNRHGADVISRSEDILGPARAARIGPADLSRNVLRSWCTRVCRAYSRPPLATGVTDELAAALGDRSASTTIERYAEAGGRPLPTTVAQASGEAQWYQESAGFCGVRIGWSRRTGRILLQVVTPDDLEVEYASDDPTEPTVIRHRGVRVLGDEAVEVVEVYDLTDLDAPSYRVMQGDADVTERVHGRTFEGAGYLAEWSFSDGTPYHPIVVRGHPRHMYARLQQVEASLVVPVRWTAWGSGCDFSSHPGLNVRGMVLHGQSSNTDEGATGYPAGPDVVNVWADMDPDKPGDHWQDTPAFDPLTIGKAVGFYESMTLSMIDLPIQTEATGGEPTKREMEAQEEAIEGTFPECRRFDSELLRRCAALANRLESVQGDDIPEGPYGLLYRGEVDQALAQDPSSEE